jgi:hypothetical protein
MVKRMMVVVATVIALLACGLLPSQEANPAAPQLAPTQLTCPATVCPTCPAPPTATNTPQVTSTPTLTRTPTLTLTPTPIPWQYIKQANSPLYMQNFAHTAEGCNWLGIAGQVFTTSGKTINNIVVNVSGTLNGKALDLLGMSGTSRAYGPGGYEIVLGNKPVDSTGVMTITLYDLNGVQLSDKLQFDTFSDCRKNLVIMNFTEKATH